MKYRSGKTRGWRQGESTKYLRWFSGTDHQPAGALAALLPLFDHGNTCWINKIRFDEIKEPLRRYQKGKTEREWKERREENLIDKLDLVHGQNSRGCRGLFRSRVGNLIHFISFRFNFFHFGGKRAQMPPWGGRSGGRNMWTISCRAERYLEPSRNSKSTTHRNNI